jgi:tRNA(Ile)-lysidine synthase
MSHSQAYSETMDRIVSKVRDFIARHSLIEPDERVLLCLSAGKDSMLLFHVLDTLRPELGFAMGVFHLNHMARGAESDGDEEHLVRLTEAHDVPLHIERFDFAAHREKGRSFEEHARAKRYELAEAISAEHGYEKIATAHTASDHVETILMRVLTGTGIHGLQGIRPRRDRIIRPLLPLTSDEVYGCLKAMGIPWREDSSNASASHPRNFIRHEILPLARSRFAAADEALQSLSEQAGDAMSLIGQTVAELYPRMFEYSAGDLYIEAGPLAHGWPLFAYAVSEGMRRYFNCPPNGKMLREFYAKYRVNRSNIKLYRDSAICVDKVYDSGGSRLRISEASKSYACPDEWEYRIDAPGSGRTRVRLEEIGVTIAVEIVDNARFRKFVKNNGYVFISMEKSVKTLYIRNRRKGDRMRTERGTKKIKDLLIERKLDERSKERVPLLVAGSEVIAFMPGLVFDIPNRVSADFLVDKNAEKVLSVSKN